MPRRCIISDIDPARTIGGFEAGLHLWLVAGPFPDDETVRLDLSLQSLPSRFHDDFVIWSLKAKPAGIED